MTALPFALAVALILVYALVLLVGTLSSFEESDENGGEEP